MWFKKLFTLLLLPALTACTTSDPVPFKVGKDACDHCKMTIMSKTFGMELITAKGKVFKFDDIICCVNYLNKNGKEGDLLYVAENSKGALIPASAAFYLKSEKNRTPMNSQIIAFSNKSAAVNVQKSKGGEILTWENVKALY